MNSVLLSLLDKECPKFNKTTMDGISSEFLRRILDYIDGVFKDSVKSLPPQINFRYNGYEIPPLNEECEYTLANTGNSSKPCIDISRSDVYCVKFKFSYNDEPIEKPVYLPYSDSHNIMYVSDVPYSISPVVTDNVISYTNRGLFIRLLKDKIIVNSVTRGILIDGVKHPAHIIYSNLVKSKVLDLTDNIGKPVTPLVLYFLARDGLQGTFARYFNWRTDDVICSTDDKEGYICFASTGIKPSGLKTAYYTPHLLKVLVRRSQYERLTTQQKSFVCNVVAGFIYALDLLPHHAEEALITHDSEFFTTLLARVAYTNSYSISRMLDDIKSHIGTLDGYMDEVIRVRLKGKFTFACDIEVNDIYDLLYLAVKNYDEYMLNYIKFSSSLSNKYIDVIYYLSYEITYNFNKFIFKLIRKTNRQNSPLSYREVDKILSDLRAKSIFGLVKTSEPNLCIQTVDTSLDIAYPKVTAVLEDQSRGKGVKKGTSIQFPESTRLLRGHDLYIGSLLYLTKNKPSPRFRVNPYFGCCMDTGAINVDPELDIILQQLDRDLSGAVPIEVGSDLSSGLQEQPETHDE